MKERKGKFDERLSEHKRDSSGGVLLSTPFPSPTLTTVATDSLAEDTFPSPTLTTVVTDSLAEDTFQSTAGRCRAGRWFAGRGSCLGSSWALGC